MAEPPLAEVIVRDESSGTLVQYGFSVLAHHTVRVGRDPSNNHALGHALVSRNHLEIYAVLFDEEEAHQPLIFVRDLQSCNGTFVNGILIGKGPDPSPARLLEDGDQITIAPSLSFTLCQHFIQPLQFYLSPIQHAELAVVEQEYVVKNRTVGDGSFSHVHIAIESKTNDQLVCKVQDLDGLSRKDPSLVDCADQEVAILSQLDHPNILSFKRALRTSHTLYTFTELGTGGDLYSMLNREQVIEDREVKWILRQILGGLAYLHAKGVAHQDIKLENVLCMSSYKPGSRIAICDFGSAALLSSGGTACRVGTTLYQAPECRTPDQLLDQAVDIWAVGLMAVQLLASNVGVLQPDDLPGGVPDLHKLLGKVEARRARYGTEPIPQSGLGFVKACLQLQPQKRLTAAQALTHPWLNEPPSDRDLFVRRESYIAQLWKPRPIVFPLVVNLPRRDEEDKRRSSRARGQNIGSLSPSPYFHFTTQPCLAETRKRLLLEDEPGRNELNNDLEPSTVMKTAVGIRKAHSSPLLDSHYEDSEQARKKRKYSLRQDVG